ncbi:universal stress protein [Terracoccus luteus]|jgi:nucleotide-binding universal stress UspA family protein|uniref:universal stress protein n=1 Tax=Terracoccus luteus TaxID=53356 RepID=UPI0027E3C2E1|nr:universal stress protein [Terracoccus luteus]
MSVKHEMPAGAIAVGYDGGVSSRVALAWATREARVARRAVHLVHMIAWPEDIVVNLAIDEDDDETTAAGVAYVRRHAPDVDVSCETRTGNAAGRLLRLSERASTVVVGGHGHHASRAVLVGATAPQVAAHSRCAVIVVPDEPGDPSDQDGVEDVDRPPRRVAVGIDGSESCSGAIEFAFDRASRIGSGLTAVACWWWQEGGAYLAGAEGYGWDPDLHDRELRLVSEQLAGWSEKYPDVDVRTVLVHGNAVSVLTEEADRAELLVLGTRGRGGFAGLLLGSVSLRVMTGAHRPVAIVPSRLGKAPG